MFSSLTPYEANIKKWLIPVTRSEIDKRLNNNPKLRRFMTRLAILLRTSFLILTLICASQTMARSQKYKVTIKVKEQKMLDVFKSIQQQTNLIVFYSNTILNDQEKVSIQVKDEPLEKVLDKIIAGKALKYEVQEKYIVIAPKEEKKGVKEIKEGMSVEEVAPPPPEIDVVVRVTDEEGNPLVGASVMIRGTKTGAQTNEAGIASLKGVADNAVLEVSFVGYENKVVSVSKRNAIVLELKKKENELQEVIVGKGYYEEKQRFSVSNVTRISSKDLEKQPVNNVMLALQGRVPGLNITQQTGMNGGGIQVRIQGENSIANGNDPLIIVDGVPYPTELPLALFSTPLIGNGGLGSPLSFININDIESVDILKDADATSLFGSRAANGAILITTKKGKPGKMKVNINLQQGWSRVTRRMEMLNTRQYLDMRYEAFRNSNQIPVDRTGLPAGNIYAPDLTIWDTTRYTDWQQELIGGTAQYSNFNATLSGGSQASNYLVGFTYSRNTDVYPGEHALNNGALHFNMNTASVNQKFKMKLSGTYTNNKNSLPGTDLTAAAIRLTPVAPALFHGDSLNWAPNAAGIDTWENPLVNSFYSQYKSTANVLYSNLNFSYILLPGLEFRNQLGYNYIQSRSSRQVPLVAIRPALRPTSNRSASFNNSTVYNYTFEPQLVYNKLWGKLQIDAILGSTVQQNGTQAISINASGYSSDLLLNSTAGATSINTIINQSIYKYSAGFTHFGFNWENKYLLSLNARRDGSSRFGEKRRFNNFGSVGGGWIFSKMSAFQRFLPWLNFGKLRFSYGTTGSDQIGDYSFLSNNGAFGNTIISYQGTSGLYAENLLNPYLQWEESRKLQIGIDLGLWQDRIQVNFSYSQNRCSNQLIDYNLPAITGFSTVKENLPATVQNTSWEFMLNSVNINNAKLNWSTRLNLTIPRNSVIRFPGIENTIYSNLFSGIAVGQPSGSIWLYSYMGMDPATGSHVAADAAGNPSTLGFFNRYINTAPIYYGGVQNSITYKNVSVDFLFQFVRQVGRKDLYFWNGIHIPGYETRGWGNQPVSVLSRWQKPGDQAFVAPFSAVNGNLGVLTRSDAFYTLDASYIRLKNISLSWSLTPAFCKKFGIQNCRIYSQGQNLLTITKFKGLDPENQSGTSLPPLRTWTVGLQVGF